MKYSIAICCSVLLSIQALAQPAMVLGPDLEPKTVGLDTVSLSDDGLLRLRLSADPITPLNNKQYVARLVDGQVLVGTLMDAGKDGETIRLAMDYQQRSVAFPLDDLLSLALVGTSLVGDASDDTLLLATGETLIGFVDAIGEDGIGFVIGDAEDPIQIPMDRIRGFSIANKPQPVKAEKGLARVLLRGGSSLLLRDAALKRATKREGSSLSGTLTIGGESTTITMPLNEVHLIEPRSGRYVLERLADSAMTLISGGEVFSVKMPPRIDRDGSIHLHAPTTLGFDLSKGASRLAFMVAMDLDDTIPQTRRAMAGCELIVYDGDEVIARHTLTPDGPPKRLNVALAGGDLRIALQAGVNGPVLDRVVISQAELLVSE